MVAVEGTEPKLLNQNKMVDSVETTKAAAPAEIKKVTCPACKSEDIRNYSTYKSCNNCGKNFK